VRIESHAKRVRALIILAGLLQLGCTPLAPRLAPVASANAFNVEALFLGRTEGIGTLKVMFAPARTVHVRGQGRLAADGTLVLEQQVERAGKKTAHRTWRIRQISPGHYTGTLSDAAGPVSLDVRGERLQIRYALKSGGTRAEQWLDMRPDGSASNHMTFKRFGVRVATLQETIRRIA
jgi:hypothetical protein